MRRWMYKQMVLSRLADGREIENIQIIKRKGTAIVDAAAGVVEDLPHSSIPAKKLGYHLVRAAHWLRGRIFLMRLYFVVSFPLY